MNDTPNDANSDTRDRLQTKPIPTLRLQIGTVCGLCTGPFFGPEGEGNKSWNFGFLRFWAGLGSGEGSQSRFVLRYYQASGSIRSYVGIFLSNLNVRMFTLRTDDPVRQKYNRRQQISVQWNWVPRQLLGPCTWWLVNVCANWALWDLVLPTVTLPVVLWRFFPRGTVRFGLRTCHHGHVGCWSGLLWVWG